jgi:hypothetical protein
VCSAVAISAKSEESFSRCNGRYACVCADVSKSSRCCGSKLQEKGAVGLALVAPNNSDSICSHSKSTKGIMKTMVATQIVRTIESSRYHIMCIIRSSMERINCRRRAV